MGATLLTRDPDCGANVHGLCGNTENLEAVRGGCEHEHIQDGWLCPRHRNAALNCNQCLHADVSHFCRVIFTAIPVYECAYSRCERVFLTKPYRRPDEVEWLGADGAATYCDSLCADAETDARVELRPVIV